jgi:outer membrane lipoprotein SlyB
MPKFARNTFAALSAMAVLAAIPGNAEARRVKVCRKSSGTAGLITGGAAGAVVGHAVLGGPVGIAAGAVGGAFGGRAIDRTITAHKRCHYETRR